MDEKEIEQLKQEKEEALSKASALQEEVDNLKKSKDELQGKYDSLAKDQDELRKLNGKLLLKIGNQEDEKEKGKQDNPDDNLTLEQKVLKILETK